MLTDENFEDLNVKGYTVVKGVVAEEECDDAVKEYREWLEQFGRVFPRNFHGIINKYKTGHLEVTWKLRLKTKPLFAQLWKTEKLLTSFDAIAIGRPPEEGKEPFQTHEKYWLHTDQSANKLGLHAYQGALYLEEQCHDDWTFQVMEGSHLFQDEFFSKNKDAAKTSLIGHFKMTDESLDFYKQAGCKTVRVPVPKGGFVLWDSRLIHANARPLENRAHPGRWRFVTFVSMTPAIWASQKDISMHKKCYREAEMTTHWSSQGLRVTRDTARASNIAVPVTVPVIARMDEVRRLSGDLQYNFEDGLPNGSEHTPKWAD